MPAGVINGQAVDAPVTNGAFLSTTLGTEGFPILITAAGGLSFVSPQERNQRFIAGDSGPVTVSANPQITIGSTLCQVILLIGQDDTNTVTFVDGTGLSLNGSATLGLNKTLKLMWTGSVWLEISRNF